MDANSPLMYTTSSPPRPSPTSDVNSRGPFTGPRLLESCGSMWVVRRTAKPTANQKKHDEGNNSSAVASEMSRVPNGFTDVFMLHGSSEPISCGIDVITGHLILSYMEAYLREDSRMNADWEAVNAYEAEEATPCVDAQRPENLMKNRLIAPLPYEQSRVRLRFGDNDYINASLIYDHTPRNPVYIATPTPLADTVTHFWQMVWEQSCVIIVCLERPADLKQYNEQLADPELTDACIQYWPNEGTRAYGNFEVHLVSEHSSCDKYVVRSLYLKNLQTSETRTVTQFHYLTWNNEKLKSETKALLDFRRYAHGIDE
ncbi:unnamed protein product [Echinostoma caproni]|uniref:Tyrosine-protein phosphatase domain-containing protein n=1 Tax=Echinostoma caproni TaxID=27848 RepID=A0A183ASB7_9TREM|nr:unnamed protein product [Echinostoma caproni]